MHTLKLLLVASFTLASVACNNAKPETSPENVIDTIAASLNVNYAVTHNKWGEACALPDGSGRIEKGPCYEGNITLSADKNIENSNWEIYFSQVEPLFAFSTDEFEVDHLNGDLHRIRPTEAFTGFQADDTKIIHLVVSGQVLTEAKLMPNYYVVAEGAQAKIIESTRLKTDPETGLIVRPYITSLDDTKRLFSKSAADNTPLADASYLYANNADIKPAPQNVIDTGIVPTPLSVIIDASGASLDISNGIQINASGVERTHVKAAISRLAMLGVKESGSGVPVTLSISEETNQTSGAYTLTITSEDINIVGSDAAGVSHALYSIAALVRLGSDTIPGMQIVDAPRFSFRGMHVDVGRNFHSKDEILKILDQMAAYKLNKLHLHLADDEGWRLEIPGLPELTEIGSKRCHDPKEDTCLLMQLGSGPTGTSKVDGYYTVAEYTEILRAASARHIVVIPSLDMPGHARAAVKSMEARYRKFMAAIDEAGALQYLLSDPEDASEYQSIQYYSDNTINPCMESSYAFLDKIIDEVQKIHEAADHPLTRYHIGADETAGAWTASPICEAFFKDNNAGVTDSKQLTTYFIARVAAMLDERGIIPAAWNDGLDHADPKKLPKKLQSNAWGVLPWGGAYSAQKHANYGWDVVLSHPDALYFDLPYEAHPKEGGYYWATRHVNSRKVFNFMPGNLPVHAEFWVDSSENPFEINDTKQTDENGNVKQSPLRKDAQFLGIQGHIWSETVPTDTELEYRVFPRILALAERAWHKPEWELSYNYDGEVYNKDTQNFTSYAKAQRDQDWNRFASIVGGKEFVKLDRANIAYRVPTVGAVIEDGILKANIIYPDLTIEYREDGGDWHIYTQPITVKGTVEVRARAATGKRVGRTHIVAHTD